MSDPRIDAVVQLADGARLLGEYPDQHIDALLVQYGDDIEAVVERLECDGWSPEEIESGNPDEPRYHVLEVGADAHARISTEAYRTSALAGDWVFTPLGSCASAGISTTLTPGQGIMLKEPADGDWLAFAAGLLMEVAPDIGFSVIDVEGVSTFGFICPTDELAEQYEDMLVTAYEQVAA